MDDFRKIINRELRKRAKSQYWLAREAQVSRVTLHRFLGGEGEIGHQKLERINRALGYPIRPKVTR